MSDLPELTEFEREVYSWQTTVTGFGEEGQRRLKGATVMISRVGGLGGLVAYELAAAGVGRLVLAHGGNLKPSDLNRQLLMRHDALGQARIGTAVETLKALNPRLEIVAVPENVSEANADELVAQADVVVDCAPLFEERYAMNDACVRLAKPSAIGPNFGESVTLVMIATALLDSSTREVPGVTLSANMASSRKPIRVRFTFPYVRIRAIISCPM